MGMGFAGLGVFSSSETQKNIITESHRARPCRCRGAGPIATCILNILVHDHAAHLFTRRIPLDFLASPFVIIFVAKKIISRAVPQRLSFPVPVSCTRRTHHGGGGGGGRRGDASPEQCRGSFFFFFFFFLFSWIARLLSWNWVAAGYQTLLLRSRWTTMRDK